MAVEKKASEARAAASMSMLMPNTAVMIRDTQGKVNRPARYGCAVARQWGSLCCDWNKRFARRTKFRAVILRLSFYLGGIVGPVCSCNRSSTAVSHADDQNPRAISKRANVSRTAEHFWWSAALTHLTSRAVSTHPRHFIYLSCLKIQLCR